MEKDKKDEKKWIEKEEEAEKGLKGLKERQEAITKQLEGGKGDGLGGGRGTKPSSTFSDYDTHRFSFSVVLNKWNTLYAIQYCN